MQYEIPENACVCPACNGTMIGRELTPIEKTWWPNLTHRSCDVCSWGMMGSHGYVYKDKTTGEPCINHEYEVNMKMTSYVMKKCKKCGLINERDSS